MPDLVGTEIHLFNNINMKNQKAFFMRESTETSLSNLRIVNEVTVPGGRHVKGLNAVIKNNLHSLVSTREEHPIPAGVRHSSWQYFLKEDHESQ